MHTITNVIARVATYGVFGAIPIVVFVNRRILNVAYKQKRWQSTKATQMKELRGWESRMLLLPDLD